MLVVTTSWDDGDVSDKRVIEILDRYGLKGTFYIPKEYWGERLSEDDIKAISGEHEVGAHTLSHIDLSKVDTLIATKEIEGSKAWLEEITGKNIQMFCYPRGRFTPETVRIVKDVGFHGARTTQLFALTVQNPFEIATTIQVYPLPFKTDTGFMRVFEPLQQRYAGFRSLDVPFFAMRSWESAAKAAFDTALQKGGVFHLWGHSWEIEKYDLWDEFEQVCAHIGRQSDCKYVINAELV